MQPKIILCVALVLSGGLLGCAHAPKVRSTTPMTAYAGETFSPPRKLRNGSANLQDVYTDKKAALVGKRGLG